MADLEAVLATQITGYLAKPDESLLGLICSTLERYLTATINWNKYSYVDGVLPDTVITSPDSLTLHGKFIWSDGHRQFTDPCVLWIQVDRSTLAAYHFSLGGQQSPFTPAVLTHGSPRPLVSEILPNIATALTNSLITEGESDLAATVANLRYHAPCACDVPECESFYTAPNPDRSYGEGHRNVLLAGPADLFVIDVVANQIMFVEILSSSPN